MATARVLSFGVGNLRFGDFDGDGKTDVFSLANGQWSISFGGLTSWQRLNAKLSSDLGELAFADFDGDGRTDVARSRSGTWQVSWGGATPWETLRSGSLPSFAGMLFGDFDGDRRADVLQRGIVSPLLGLVSLTRFGLSSGGTGPLVGWSTQDMR